MWGFFYAFFCPFNDLMRGVYSLHNQSVIREMAQIKVETIRRNLALKEYEVKETLLGKQVVFKIKFVKKDGELVFMPMAVAAGLKMNMKENRMRGVLPVDAQGESCGHVTPVSIDGIIEWNGKKIRM